MLLLLIEMMILALIGWTIQEGWWAVALPGLWYVGHLAVGRLLDGKE